MVLLLPMPFHAKRNQNGGHEYDLQEWLDITSHESPYRVPKCDASNCRFLRLSILMTILAHISVEHDKKKTPSQSYTKFYINRFMGARDRYGRMNT